MSRLLAILNSQFRLPVWSVLLVSIAILSAGVEVQRKFGWPIKQRPPTNQQPAHSDLATGLMSLDVTRFQLPRDYTLGAIEWLDSERLLLADGTGRFSLISHKDGIATQSPTRVSIETNRAAMANHEKSLGRTLEVGRLRLHDIVLFDDRRSLAVSYNQWNPEQECYGLVVAVREVPGDWSTATNDGWHELFHSKPCLQLKPAFWPFSGHQAGGRLADAGNGKLLVSIGDFEFDGRDGLARISQDQGSDYGKVVEIDTKTGASRHISIGHRNPQGLMVDDKGRVWSTEHGPRGGDELNLVVEDQNYGWPEVSMGVDYSLAYWPLAHRQGRHDGYRSPTYAWLPSVGISQLIQVKNFADEWDGDLLVGSLSGLSLFRLRLDDDVVRYAEPIEVAGRVRDIIQDPAGTIWVWTDGSVLLQVRPGMTATAIALSGSSAKMASARCAECHEMSKGSGSRISLAGIVGRPVASLEGIEYSEGLRALGGVWTEERLDDFLKEPGAMAPGTPMAEQGIADEKTRASIIDALQALK